MGEFPKLSLRLPAGLLESSVSLLELKFDDDSNFGGGCRLVLIEGTFFVGLVGLFFLLLIKGICIDVD